MNTTCAVHPAKERAMGEGNSPAGYDREWREQHTSNTALLRSPSAVRYE